MAFIFEQIEMVETENHFISNEIRNIEHISQIRNIISFSEYELSLVKVSK